MTAGSDGRVRTPVSVLSGRVTQKLLTALALPDQEFPPESHYACAAVAILPTYLLLVDEQNRAVRPLLPLDPCRVPRGEVDAAVQSLSLRQVDSYTYQGHS